MENIEIPTGTQVSIEGGAIRIKGRLGSAEKRCNPKFAKAKVEGNLLVVESSSVKQIMKRGGHAEVALANELRETIKSVNEGIEQKMKVVYAHFPMSVEVKGKEVSIKNIFGEKIARKAAIVGSTTVEVKGQDVTVKGIDRYEVGQTIANIRKACGARGKDTRVFQDGIYKAQEE